MLEQDDHALSMLISPRRRNKPDPPNLRTLLVHRLSDTYKTVLRRGLERGNLSMLCEPCRRWERMEEFPPEFTCSNCDRTYRVEFVIYEEIDTEPE